MKRLRGLQVPKPVVLLGDGQSALTRSLFEAYGWGRMVVDRTPRPVPGEPWALDNGAYRDFKAGRLPDWTRFLRRLEKMAKRLQEGELHPPLFVVVPDLIGAGAAGLRYSLAWRERLRSSYSHLPLRWYLVVADGFEPEGVGRALPFVDGLFLAGTDECKEHESALWRQVAKECGKGFHYARCSTPKHLERALSLEVDSLDTARPLTRREYLAEFERVFLAAGGV
jgi:hypothetical protein